MPHRKGLQQDIDYFQNKRNTATPITEVHKPSCTVHRYIGIPRHYSTFLLSTHQHFVYQKARDK